MNMSDDQLAKLSKKIDQGFVEVNKKLINHDQSFERFFTYMEKRFNEMDAQFDKQDKKIDGLSAAVGELSAQVKSYHEEMLFLTHKVDRMERWIHEIAEQTGVKLSEA
jgi:uncharacterized coiled-coil protein SlyX